VASGEFGVLHKAQLAIAREHGLANWAALKAVVDREARPASRVVPQLRWLLSRFGDAHGPGWSPPGGAELREHFSERVLSDVPPDELAARFARLAAGLTEEQLVVTGESPFAARARIGGTEIAATVDPVAPYRLTAVRAIPLGSRVIDARVARPTNRAQGEIPAASIDVAEGAFADLGLVGLLVAAGAPGGPVWSLARGWADLGRVQLLRIDHRFPAYGLTQPVTATVVLRLVAAGHLGLDDPANDHLRAVRLADDTVTVRELLSHTGGVDHAVEALADRVPELASLTGPVIACNGARGTFRYSNEGYAALGQLIADVTGLPYADAATRLVLKPLGMGRAGFPSTADGAADAVTQYTPTPGGRFAPVPARAFTMPAAGGLWASAADLVGFGIGWSSLLPAALAREALRPHAREPGHTGERGLGWIVNRRIGVAGSGGQASGACASLLIGTDNHACVALTNRVARIEPISARVLHACTASAHDDE
jgi:CubicO group peptidase (beta-lactamase class C family)